MARYTVIWDPVVEANFTDMWTKSDSQTRAILTRIANHADAELAMDPDNKGIERDEIGGRVLTIPIPGARVSVIYNVRTADRQVVIKRFNFRRVN